MISSIFRAYDIRGIYPSELNEDVAQQVGNATARFLNAKTLVVGEDGRISSPKLTQAVIDGITSAGCDVLYIGQCSTPLFYFASRNLGGIMITASHNPPEYNGLKIVDKDGNPIGLDNHLGDIKDLMEKGIEESEKKGKIIEKPEIREEYVDFLIKTSGVKAGDIKFKVVVDAGNGMAGAVIKPLFERLKIDYVPLFFDIDGSFPNRPPDPAKEGALNLLKETVRQEKTALGIAFDGDADRVAFVDEKGSDVPAQFVLALLWFAEKNKPKVVYDLRFSRAVKDIFGEYGIRSQVGHTFISHMMRKVNGGIGGETSGHFYFKEANYNESSGLAVLKLLRFLQESGKPFSELAATFKKYYYSGEISIEMGDTSKAEEIFESLQKRYSDGAWDKFDGLTIEYWNESFDKLRAPTKGRWWFNLRPSNTESLLRLVVEAETKELMDEKVNEIKAEIKKAAF